jgi:hypothetical protein
VPTENKPYIKSLADELDWKLLDQLYGVVSQISNFCFETKKFCITTEFIVLTLIVKFTTDKLAHSIFISALVISICFWFLDSVAYYYQVSIRGTMESIRERIKKRNQEQIVDTMGTKVITPERIHQNSLANIFDAFFNHSMWLYAFLIGIDCMVWGLFAIGVVK